MNHDLRKRLVTKFIPTQSKKPLALAIGAEYGPAKRWPNAHFATVARHWMSTGGWVWIIGTKADRKHGEDIRLSLDSNMRERCLNLCGKTNLKEAVALLASATQVISNDSGLMHISAALERPLVALFGSSSARHTPPLSTRATALSMRLECAPCFKRTCPLRHHNCLKRMWPDLVIQQLHPK
jgi:heptosyltransferase-2